MKVCPKCRATNADWARECHRCDTSLERVPVTEEAQHPDQAVLEVELEAE